MSHSTDMSLVRRDTKGGQASRFLLLSRLRGNLADNQIQTCGFGECPEIVVSGQQRDIGIQAVLGDQRITQTCPSALASTFARNAPARCQ
jgi:hypothetical protein